MSPTTPPDSPDRVPSKSETESTLNGRFFRYFQQEVTALQKQMDHLVDTPVVAGEQTDAIDHCLAGISRLLNEVKDASSYIPTYDQRVYAEAIKALQDKLAETRSKIKPRQKFTFKTARKNPSAISLSDAAELATQGRHHIPGYRSNENSSVELLTDPTPTHPLTPSSDTWLVPESIKDRQTGEDSKHTRIPRLTNSEAPVVSVDSHTDVHIVLPTSASHATVGASITCLQNCAVDLSIPTANGQPFASLTINSISDSLLVCGQVNGAAHITDVKHSVLVVSCRQFRMHECKNVDVYLSCSSKPIIEDCSGIRFSKIPIPYSLDAESRNDTDLWAEVEDFKWLKSEPSPNWSILDESKIIPDDVWAGISTGKPGWSLDDILKVTKVVRS